MTFSISALVLARDSHIKPDSEANSISGICAMVSKNICPCTILRSTLFGIFLKPDSNKVNSLNDLFSQFVSSKIFFAYKSQCLEKVNVKYVIKRSWHEIFHRSIVPGINPRPISSLQLRCRAWYGSLGLIPGPIWKMTCNNLLKYGYMRANTDIWGQIRIFTPYLPWGQGK
jgi:hypothetical protein